MKVAIVTHNVKRADGQGRVGYEIVRYALDQGAQVTLLADQVDQDLLERGVRWVPVQPTLRRANLLKVRQSAQMANRALHSLGERFDIVQGFGYTLTAPHHVSACQFVHHAWGRCPSHAARVHRNLYGLYQGTYTRFNSRWERHAYASAEHIVACSDQVEQELRTIGVPASKIKVILNAVDTQEFQPAKANCTLDRAAERTALGLPPEHTLALFAGDIRMPRKNLDTVLRALAHVDGLHLIVVGETKNSPYPNLAARLGLGARVHFLGFRRDMADLMRACDMFVFPSRYEPFGIVVLEAMAAGMPVITARTVGAAQLITPECGAVLDEPDDVEGMAKALNSLRANSTGGRAMGRAGRRIAEQHTWVEMARAYWRLYQEIAS